jgi:AraC family transcriptional regulator
LSVIADAFVVFFRYSAIGMPSSTNRVRRLIKRIAGNPVGSGRVQARWPIVLDRHQALFESITVPPLPIPLLLVHTGGKPMDYLSKDRRRLKQSLPGLVTFVPRNVRAEVALRGVGEGTVVYFDDERRLPAWLLRSRTGEPVTFTNDVIVSITRRLMNELEARSRAEPYLKAIANALLAELQRELELPRAAIELPASRGRLRVAHVAMRHMHAHLGETLSVRDLARVCGVGVTSFTSSFREAAGVTPHRYLRRTRIERSCELLRTTGLSIREVAEIVGFRGQSHFCSAFVAERGLTPSAYRRASHVRIQLAGQ